MQYFYQSKLGNTRHVLADGSLLCTDVPIARTGQQEYLESELEGFKGKDGLIIVDRNPEEVFKPETIASFEGMSLTYHHPNESVTPENWKKYAVGHAQNVRRGELENSNYIMADLVFKDQEAIRAINNGIIEISCGYDAEYSQEEDGRASQHNIIGNHVALVPNARGGAALSIQDSKPKGVVKVGKHTGIKGLIRDARRALFSKDEAAAQEALNHVEDEAEKLENDNEPEKKEGTFDAESEIKTLKDSMEKIMDSLEELKKGTGDSQGGEKETGLTGDSAQDVISKAELIMPGIDIPSKVTHDFKRTVLNTVKSTRDGKVLLAKSGVDTVDFNKADKATVDMAFNTVSVVAKTQNTSQTQTKDSKPFAPKTNAELNAIYQDYYSKGAK